MSGKLAEGEKLSKTEQAEMKANPRLKAEVDRKVAQQREDGERRAIVEQEGRAISARPRAPTRDGPVEVRPRARDAEDGGGRRGTRTDLRAPSAGNP